jgi:raffinose/stachyose/melibiose transport system permease protein
MRPFGPRAQRNYFFSPPGSGVCMTKRSEEKFSYAVLVLPALLIYLAVVTFPIIFSILLSLTNYNGGKVFGNPNLKFVGLKSYIFMLTEPTGGFYTALKNNMFIVAVSVFGQIPLGLFLAYFLNQKMIKGKNLFQALIYLPNVISPIIIGILFRSIYYGQNSVYMDIVRIFKPEANFAISSQPIIPVLFVILWMYTGFYMIIFLANMQRIDPQILEAARIDGAKEGQILTRIILPALFGVIITCSILAITGSLRAFDLIYAMTSGGPAGLTRVLSLYMYSMAFTGAPNYPLANAISTVMILISFLLIIVVRVVEKIISEKE